MKGMRDGGALEREALVRSNVQHKDLTLFASIVSHCAEASNQWSAWDSFKESFSHKMI